jgi:methyl-accepting chemotaxis protein
MPVPTHKRRRPPAKKAIPRNGSRLSAEPADDDDPLAPLVRAMEGVAAGRVSLGAALDELPPELRSLGDLLARAISRSTVSPLHLQTAATDLITAGTEIAATTREQAAAMTQASRSVEEVTTTVEDLSRISTESVEKTATIIEVAEKSQQISLVGQQAVTAAISEIEKLREQVRSIASNVLALNQQTQQIGDIIASVNEIAEQSKLLALNAAIEAARAGEQGRGFGVVATEIRALAEQSKQATVQVRNILLDIQKATQTAVLVSDEGNRRAEESAVRVRSIGEQLGAQLEVISQTARASKEIATSIKQQRFGLEQILAAMRGINQVVAETASGVREIEGTVRGLTIASERLSSLTSGG